MQREIAANWTANMAANSGGEGSSVQARLDSSGGACTRGKVPSYISLAAYGAEGSARSVRSAVERGGSLKGSISGGRVSPMPGVASSASLLNLAALDPSESCDTDIPPSIGMAPFPAST